MTSLIPEGFSQATTKFFHLIYFSQDYWDGLLFHKVHRLHTMCAMYLHALPFWSSLHFLLLTLVYSEQVHTL